MVECVGENQQTLSVSVAKDYRADQPCGRLALPLKEQGSFTWGG